MDPFDVERNGEREEILSPRADAPAEAGSPETEMTGSPAEPDPTKPLPGESYADYWRRLERKEHERRESEDYGRQEYWNGLSDHGRGTSGDPNYGPIPEEYEANGMSKIAFTCGAVSLAAILFNGSLPFGALGILFALLSRRKKFSRQARVALWMSAAGIFAFVIAIVMTLSMLISSGLMGKLIDRVRSADPNDPYAVAEIQQELAEDILKRYGAAY